MSRLRLNGLGSASNGLTAAAGSSGVAQTVSFASDPGFPTIAFPDYLPVVGAPGTSAEEIIWITAWTAGATSGTGIRNAEPTKSGQNNANAQSGVAWEHAPTTTDFGGGATPLGLNILPANLPNWRKAVADVVAGVGSAKVLCIGTSITNGGGVGTAIATESIPAYLAKILNALVCPAVQTLGALTPYTSDATHGDSRFAIGTGWTLPAQNGSTPGIGWANNGVVQGAVGAAGSVVFTPDPTQEIDSFDIYYYSASNTGAVNASVDGGSPTNINTNNATAAIRKTTVTCTRGAGHVLTLSTVTSNVVEIIGIDAYDSTTPSLHIGNAGVDSLGSGVNWALASPIATIEEYAPTLTLIELAGDDALAASPPTAATFLSNLQTIITACQLSGDVLLWSQAEPNPSASGITGTMLNNLAAYIQELKLESISANIAYVDITSRFGAYTAANALGLFNADGVHPNAQGNADIAGALYEALASVTTGQPVDSSPPGPPLIQTLSNAAGSVTPSTVNTETHWVTSATGTITVNNPTGTPYAGQKIILRVKTSGGAETYAFGTQYRGSTNQGLPSTSSNNKWDYLGFEWNETDSKWDLIALNQGF